jgi:hypothetical protein
MDRMLLGLTTTDQLLRDCIGAEVQCKKREEKSGLEMADRQVAQNKVKVVE